MSIDLEKAKEEFLKYTGKFDLANNRIKGKQVHSLRVMEISKKIAEGMMLTKEEVYVATLIGLLHDIARFEQYTKYGTYRDYESIDHGDYGAEILKKDIRKYIETDKYDEIIIKAVRNHNKYKIEEGLSEKQQLFSKIVRDADKIDIFYESVIMFWMGKEKQVEESIISEDVIEQFNKSIQIRIKENETPIDNIIRVIAFIFDINFKTSFQILKEENYIDKIFDRYKIKDEYTRQKVEEIIEKSKKYIEERINGDK